MPSSLQNCTLPLLKNSAKVEYEDALKKSGYNVDLKHQQQIRKTKNAKVKHGLTHPSTNPSQQTLQRHSFNW